MSKVLYFLATFAETGLSVFGIRSAYDQPPYTVERRLAPSIELRAYPPRAVVEAPIREGNEGEAFGRLFRYLTGANTGQHLIAMTVPVEQTHPPSPMGASVQEVQAGEMQTGPAVMRFYLPPAVAAGAPVPADPLVQVHTVPAARLGVVRYAGGWDAEARASQTARLREALRRAGLTVQGGPAYFSYDPPFTIPFLRRNEVALAVMP